MEKGREPVLRSGLFSYDVSPIAVGRVPGTRILRLIGRPSCARCSTISRLQVISARQKELSEWSTGGRGRRYSNITTLLKDLLMPNFPHHVPSQDSSVRTLSVLDRIQGARPEPYVPLEINNSNQRPNWLAWQFVYWKAIP